MKNHRLDLRLVCMSLLLSGVFYADAAAADKCVRCHLKRTPHHVRVWRASAHARKKVGCKDCHGRDHKKIRAGRAPVDTKVCGRCHKKAYRQHVRSRHGMGLHSGWGCTRALSGRDPKECRFCHTKGSAMPKSVVHCARFLKQSSQMGQAGCNRCHMIERSCAACHTNHNTALSIVKSPAVCAKCHMGPDHPQWEMWKTSKHGTLYATIGKRHGPACQSCHLPKGGHDVSHGLTMSPSGLIYGKKKFARRRAEMLKVCTKCHGKSFAKRDLARADRIREQSRVLVKKAAAIIRDLHDRKLLDPMPKARKPHPQRGKVLVLDGQILYEDTSHIERLFFVMKKYYLAQTVKGAYHQNPAWTHWYGNARLKMALVDIQSEASRLRKLGRAGVARRRRAGRKASYKAIEAQLELLKRRHARGKLSKEDYARKRRLLLERFRKQ